MCFSVSDDSVEP
jgi:hypothetical protein